MDLKQRSLILIIITCTILKATSENNFCDQIAKPCTCIKHYRHYKGYVINCYEASTISVEFQYLPNILNINCKIKETSEVQKMQPLNWVNIPERLIGVSVRYFMVNNCILSNSTLTDFHFESVKYVLIAGTRSNLTKDFFTGIAFNLEALELDDVGFRRINSEIFEEMSSLTILIFKYNMLEEINEDFRGLSNLKELHLPMNGISRINENAFTGLNNLMKLRFYQNKIEYLPANIFNRLRNLASLDLSWNKLAALPPELVEGLSNLQNFSVSNNQLKSLPKYLFKNNKNLTIVSFSANPYLKRLPDAFLSNQAHLITAEFDRCSLNSIPSDLFRNTTQLESLYLNNNNITVISDKLFEDLINLKTLDLSFNSISSLTNDTFKSSYKLQTLKLNNNYLKRIHFMKLPSVIDLDLSSNLLETLDIRNLKTLEKVNLSNNNLTVEPFSNGIWNIRKFFYLRKIDLQGNLISSLDYLYPPTTLEKLDLSNNRIILLNYTELQEEYTKDPLRLNLTNNKITSIDLNNINISHLYFSLIVELNGNPLACDCHSYDLFRFFQHKMAREIGKKFMPNADNLTCESPPNLNGREVHNIKLDEVSCNVSCSVAGCECFWKPHGNTLLIDCANRGMKKYPFLNLSQKYNRYEVKLQGNYLNQGPTAGNGYENVAILDLSYNHINDITWIPDKTEVINLDNNNITHLNFYILLKLNSTTLHNNPWLCDCAARNLSVFINKNHLQYKENITCKGSKRLVSSMLEKELCPTFELLYVSLGIITALIIAISSLTFALYHKYKNEIKVWLFAHNLFLSFITENDLDIDKIYDAFISYSHMDEEFVHSELLPKLENEPDPYKICIHVRNFIPGEFISTQVIDSVRTSRRTIVILSDNFLESVWAKMEFRLAHTQAITDGVTRVIMILLGNVEENPSMDEELKAYIKTYTYIKWGDPWFWERLRYALPHTKIMESDKNDELRNISLNILHNRDISESSEQSND